MSMSTATSNASDPWEMALIHRLIRSGFELVEGAVRSPGSDARVEVIAGLHRVPPRRYDRFIARVLG